MKIEIEVYDSLCAISTFRINGIEADEYDFVVKYDHSPGTAEEEGGCGDMRADIISATDKVLKKYRISLSEYSDIAEQLSEKLTFGNCGMCA